MTFRRTFHNNGRRSSRNDDDERPDCYGDEETYDPGDSACRSCEWRPGCRVAQENERRRDGRRKLSSRNKRGNKRGTKDNRRSKQHERIERHTPGVTFWGALGKNMFLEGAQGWVDELSFGVSRIPREDYSAAFMTSQDYEEIQEQETTDQPKTAPKKSTTRRQSNG